MKSQDYRNAVESIARGQLVKALPGLKRAQITTISKQIAIFTHARLYGADVENVASPLYRDMYPDRFPQEPSTDIAERVFASGSKTD